MTTKHRENFIEDHSNVSEIMAQQDITFCQHQSLFAVIESSLKTMIAIYENSLQTIKEKEKVIINIKCELKKAKKELEKFKQISEESADTSAPTSRSPTYPALSRLPQCSHGGNVSHQMQPHTTSTPPGKQYKDPN